MTYQNIVDLLGNEAKYLLAHQCVQLPKELFREPSANHVKEVFGQSDRNERVIENLERLYGHGRLGHTGYLSILPVDQDVEHNASYSFYKNPLYFDPENILRLAVTAECNGIAASLGTLGSVAKKYAERIPFIVKLNHNELLTYPNKWDQIFFASVRQAAEMSAVAVGATIYFGSAESNRQIQEVARAFEEAHRLGLATILWAYPRNAAWKTKNMDYQAAADVTSYANHLGVTIEADIIKQKLPNGDGAFRHFAFAKENKAMYESLGSENPIDLLRIQAMNCYAGRINLLSSGGESAADGDYQTDLQAAVRAAVINKRGGGNGLIMGRKAFKRPFDEGVKIIQAIQDIYLEDLITVA